MKATARRERYEQIVFAYVRATGGRLPESMSDLLRAVREMIPDVTEGELRDAVRWAIRETNRKGAALERALRERDKPGRAGRPRLKVVRLWTRSYW